MNHYLNMYWMTFKGQCANHAHSMTPEEKLLLDKESYDFLPRHIGITQMTQNMLLYPTASQIAERGLQTGLQKGTSWSVILWCCSSCFLSAFCLLDTERCISGVGGATAASKRTRSLLVLSNPLTLTLQFPNLPPTRYPKRSQFHTKGELPLTSHMTHMTSSSTRKANCEGPNRWMWWAGIEIESAWLGSDQIWSTWINYSQTWIDLARAHPCHRQVHNHGTGHTPSAHTGYPVTRSTHFVLRKKSSNNASGHTAAPNLWVALPLCGSGIPWYSEELVQFLIQRAACMARIAEASASHRTNPQTFPIST